jgi:hypothetical protein
LGLCERQRAPEAETLVLFQRLQQQAASSSASSAALTPAQLSFIGDRHFQRHVLAQQCNHQHQQEEDPASTLLHCDESPSFGLCFRCVRCQLQLCRLAVVDEDAAEGQQQFRLSLLMSGGDDHVSDENERERGGGSAGLPASLSYLRNSSCYKSINDLISNNTTQTVTLADLQQLCKT